MYSRFAARASLGLLLITPSHFPGQGIIVLSEAHIDREVPEDLRFQLWRRAKSRGQSLQHFLLEELTALANQPFPDEAPGEIGTRSLEQMDTECVVRDPERERRKAHNVATHPSPPASLPAGGRPTDRHRAAVRDLNVLHISRRDPRPSPSQTVERWAHSIPADCCYSTQNKATGHGDQIHTSEVGSGVAPEI